MAKLKIKKQLSLELTQDYQGIAESGDLETEQLQILQVLQIQNQAMGLTNNGIVIANATHPDYPIIYCNRAFSHITGYAKQEIIGKSYRFLQGPDTDSAAIEQIRLAILHKTECQVVLKNYRKDGTPFWNELKISPVQNRQGQVTHFVGVQNDITRRKEAEEKLHANEERFRQVVNSISDHIYVTEISKEGVYTNLYLSPHAQTLTGYPLTSLEADWNFWPSEIIYREDRALATTQAKRLAAGIDSEVEYRIKRADGQIIWVRDSGRVTQEGESTIVYGVVSDITERKHTEEKRQHAQKMEAIGQLAGGVAHDFNNLLTVIYGHCELLLSEISHPKDFRREELEQIKTASEQAIILTHQLLTFSRQRSPQSEVIDLNRIIHQFKGMLQRLIGENIDLVDNLSPNLNKIKADPGQIEQVLMNLVINARDAMPKGGRLTISTANIQLDNNSTKNLELAPGSYVWFAVTDTGQGIDTATQLRIFEPFFTTKAIGKGTGLGLSTVYGIIQQNGGQIDVTSQLGEGATFEIWLPAATKTARTTMANTPDLSDLTGHETILLVEDEVNVRTIIHKFLHRRGYNVIEAKNVQEALELCRQDKLQIDLIVTDIIMPEMNGYDLVKQVSQWHADLKVLYVSGYSDDVLDKHDIGQEGVALLEKPFSSVALARKVREVLTSSVNFQPELAKVSQVVDKDAPSDQREID